MISSSRELLNKYLPDVWIYSDLSKNVETPSYGISLMAERLIFKISSLKSLITAEEIYDPLQ